LFFNQSNIISSKLTIKTGLDKAKIPVENCGKFYGKVVVWLKTE
jgi:hypothetical protein